MEEEFYKSIGLRVGLEIHQRLDSHKLFCNCPSTLRDEEPHQWIRRNLNISYSELGFIDPAAKFESLRRRDFFYGVYYDTTCEIEVDEAPPLPLNDEALEIAIEIALMLNMKPVDEVHVMRKIVIDGSNTTGFQRTALVALRGEKSYIDTSKGKVGLETLCLEEESAFIVESTSEFAKYKLDRLGIPLVEIATSPDVWHPEQAMEAALRIGRILRATGRVQRGIGTIRQDINISIEGGARQEIKGIQELELIPEIVRREISRQQNLLRIKEELEHRGIRESYFSDPVEDITDIFLGKKSRLIEGAISKGDRVFGMRVRGMRGLIGREVQPGRRFGTELADYARVFGGVKGIIHGDELPSYGISDEDVKMIRERLLCQDDDSFVLVFGQKVTSLLALESVRSRLKAAVRGVPSETRRALPDGNTSFMRPMPGSARMYPETDVLPVKTAPIIARIKRLPRMPEDIVRELVENYGINSELAWELYDDGKVELFKRLVAYGAPASFTASTLTSTIKMLRREDERVERISEGHLEEIFRLIGEGKLAKEAVPEVLRGISRGSFSSVYDYVRGHSISLEELDSVIDSVLERLRYRISERGSRAFSMVMGEVMSVVRGRIDGAIVSERVKKKLEEFIKA
ncbi:MAG: Glu-tRNA(Gln) amidotransferase subunit GatE [Candidatus Korarchaeum sp.]